MPTVVAPGMKFDLENAKLFFFFFFFPPSPNVAEDLLKRGGDFFKKKGVNMRTIFNIKKLLNAMNTHCIQDIRRQNLYLGSKN